MYILPAFIEKSIITQLRIRSCDECNKLCESFPILRLFKNVDDVINYITLNYTGR